MGGNGGRRRPERGIVAERFESINVCGASKPGAHPMKVVSDGTKRAGARKGAMNPAYRTWPNPEGSGSSTVGGSPEDGMAAPAGRIRAKRPSSREC